MATSDIVVLLPGILGSVLQKGGKEVWSLSAGSLFRGLFSLGGSVESLALDHDSLDDVVDDVTATRLLPDTTILPGLWSVDGYTRIGATLRERLGLVPGETYFEFAYDWRRDNRVAARRLAKLVPEWLEAHARRTGATNPKAVLLGHSMGGLVARYYLEVLGGYEHARALVTFGTPFRGSINALDILVNGFRKSLGPLTVDLTSMVRTFTSVYQLLPTYSCFATADGLKHLLDVDTIPNLDIDKLRAARWFHAEMDEAARTNIAAGGPRYASYFFVGLHQPTYQSARPVDGGVEPLRWLDGQDFKGDGTVPRLATVPDELRHAGVERYATERHASLQNCADVLLQLEGILTEDQSDLFADRIGLGPRPSTFPKGIGPTGVSLDIGDVFRDDEPVALGARPVPPATPEAVKLVADIVSLDSPETLSIPLTLDPNSGWHRGTAPPLPSGAYRVTVRGGTDVTPVSDVFAVYAAVPD
jgi:pimeloyl-ACP methyl ester carboxylesterase